MTITDYQKFLESKIKTHVPTGFDLPIETLNPHLFNYQRDIVHWALKKGRAAIFSHTGTGKTIMQLSYGQHVHEYTGGNLLILTPLAVAAQTVLEGKKYGIPVNLCKTQADVKPGLNITNYDKLEHFELESFTGIILDESSILKHSDSKYRMYLTEACKTIPYRLACTATPAPNDFMELGNHAEFLGIMSMSEMLSMYFVHDGKETQKWRLKGHATDAFWRWMCTWSVMLKLPSDLGYSDEGFILPPLTVHEHITESPASEGQLFAMEAKTLLERQQARKASIDSRIAKAAEIINNSDGQWLVWCNLNEESEKITKALKDAIEIRGSDKPEKKERVLIGFANNEVEKLVTKPSIAGYGLNFQSCNQMLFLGLNDSYEDYFQAVRRCWRYGQKNPVSAHLIISEAEGAVLKNIQRKEKDAETMSESMINNMRTEMNKEIHGSKKESDIYETSFFENDKFRLWLGDSIETGKEIADNSIHYSIFSPPFDSLYTYSNSIRDLGNSANSNEFLTHMKFIAENLFRIIISGRLVSFHCMNLPTSKTKDGYIGIRDFRGELIKLFQDAGFIYHSEVCIWKDPVIAMQRTKALGLLHKQLKKDSAMSRQGIPDYLVTMRKPGINPEPVSHTNESFPVSVWQRYASPIWTDINPSDTLQYKSAREFDDERHICPLQIGVIRRGIELWTNPGDIVYTPFAGIGSEMVTALEMGRKAAGGELKKSYHKQALQNCLNVDINRKEQPSLFDLDTSEPFSLTALLED